MNATIVTEDPWLSRIGPDATRERNRWRRSAAWVRCLGIVIAILLAIAVAAGSRTVPQLVGDEATVDGGPLIVLVLTSVLASFSITAFFFLEVMAGRARIAAEGSAWRALSSGRGISAYEIGRHLRSVEDFDRWAAARGIGEPTIASPSESAWTPDLVRPILPGPTAVEAAVWMQVASGITLLIVFIGAVMLGVDGESFDYPIYARWMVLAFGIFVAMMIYAAARVRAEYRRGYATVRRPRSALFIDGGAAADLVDARTGMLLRPAGAAPLDRATVVARIDAIRAAHPDARPQRLP